MASASTTVVSGTSPYVSLTITEYSRTDTTLTISYVLKYHATYAASTSVNKSYSIVIDGSTVKSGSYNIDGKTGTHTIASGTKTITRETSAKSVTCSASFSFNLTWSGTAMGVKTCSLTYSIPYRSAYAIKFNANGGSGAPSTQNKWHDISTTLSSTKPTRTGYTFKGWGTSASDTSVDYAPGASYTANKSITLYAIWSPYTYAVTYNANGGTGAPSNQTKKYGTTLKLSSVEPTRTNYAFIGWGTSASAKTVAYAAGANYTANAAIALYAIWELNYTKPRITSFSITRCTSDGSASDEGTYALVKFDWACDRTVSKVVIECADANGYVTPTNVTASGISGTVNKIIGAGGLSNEGTYTIRVVVEDAVGRSTATKTLSGIVLLIDCLRGGNGIAFGKPAQMEGYADFGWDAHFDNNLAIAGRDLLGNIKEAFQPQNSNGNTVIGWGNFNLQNGNTNIYGHDILFGVSNTHAEDKDQFRPYRRQGDSISISIRVAGYVTNSGKDVSFSVPLNMPVIGNPTITVTSGNGFVLRQGNSYTHGSDANTYAFPDSYDVNMTYFLGIHITAHFSNTTNVTNNDAIGIYWNGTITFT